jgi:squalene-associated FAD-dependent desaturase
VGCAGLGERGPSKTICAAVKCAGTLYQRLARPLWLAALNIEPKEASASLAGAVLRETLAAGGKACRPLIARDGLGEVFVTPALHFLSEHGAKVVFGHRLRALGLAHDKVTTLDFGDDNVATGDADVILAVPPTVAAALVPELATPAQFRAIVNAHFRLEPPVGLAPITGIVNGTIEWLFTFPGRLSVTISAADRLLDIPRETLAKHLWQEVAAVAGLPIALPPWQIVRERRATFAATPGENAKRPAAPTAWSNLRLAGDWTNTGLPATIEGAIRSGNRAADLVA